ncbi:MAG TPA: EscN/YscN/HrcN family type III secretion system ATPase, partial [bacterium]|nr:EscN/YscN/HrcN family type III secretion system ATPase [bacterium]
MNTVPFEDYHEVLKNTDTITRCGVVTESRGLIVETRGPQASIGEICKIECGGNKKVMAEVVGFRDNRLLLMPLGDLEGIA